MPPRRRVTLRTANRRNRSPTPTHSDADQDLMEAQDDAAPSPHEQEQEPEDEEQNVADDAGNSPAARSRDGVSPAGSAPSPSGSVPPGGRGRGRGRRGRPPTRRVELAGTPDAGEEGSDSPVKKKRGGFRGGFRGRPRRGAQGLSHAARQPVDKDGNPLDVQDDEIVVEGDPEGEEKVNKNGELQGGREYRVRTFSIAGRENRLYMLSTEPARCTGYRDSYLFFTKHPQLFKIILDDLEKKDLIEREVLPNSYKGRNIGVVTARSVFREFGAKIVVGGKKIIDDYKAHEARARGDVEGELADPDDRLPAEGQSYNRNQYVAWHGASSVYHQNPPAGPGVHGMPAAGRKRPRITGANWMLEHARAASVFNSELAAQRRQNSHGLYDPHTNVMSYPQMMQPTQVRWEQVAVADDERPAKRQRSLLTNGDTSLPDVVQSGHTVSLSPSLPAPSALVTRNYLVIDTHFITPPHASLPRPGKRFGDVDEVMGTGSDHRCLPKYSDVDLGMFAPEVREAFTKAKELEASWTNMWQSGAVDSSRSRLKIGVGSL